MRLQQRRLKPVTLWKPLDNGDDKVYRWEQGVEIQVAHQPLRSYLEAQIYGEKVKNMRQLFYKGPHSLQEGMGVSLFVGKEESCDYRIISVEGWEVQRAELELIPEGRRG